MRRVVVASAVLSGSKPRMRWGQRTLQRAALSVLLLLTSNVSVFAHGSGPHDFDELVRTWPAEPGVLIPLALSLLLYVIGFVRLRRASPRALGAIEITCFAAGWLTLFVALASPLHPWGSVLFSAHMTQHELLMLVAAPLFVLSRPMIPFLWALPKSAAREMNSWSRTAAWQRVWNTITLPFVAWVIHAIVLWSWHVPFLFEATIANEWVHALQHASFLFSALLFWWAIIHGRSRAIGFGVAVLYMFTTALHSGLLGALLTFTRSVWYPIYNDTTASWGLTPLEDQQLGGLIMWIPAALVYIVAALALFVGWMRESERRAVASAVSADHGEIALSTAHASTQT